MWFGVNSLIITRQSCRKRSTTTMTWRKILLLLEKRFQSQDHQNHVILAVRWAIRILLLSIRNSCGLSIPSHSYMNQFNGPWYWPGFGLLSSFEPLLRKNQRGLKAHRISFFLHNLFLVLFRPRLTFQS